MSEKIITERRMSKRIPVPGWIGTIADAKGREYHIDIKDISWDGIKVLNHGLPMSGVISIWLKEYDLLAGLYCTKLYENTEGTVYLISLSSDFEELKTYGTIYQIKLAQMIESMEEET